VIRLTRGRHLGAVLRDLRHGSGLTIRQVGALACVSKSGVLKREQGEGGSVAALIDHLDALGYDLALVPREDAA
jgi:transcriptional regulator with XRE-family HTH domain